MKVDFEGAGPAYKSYMGATVSIIFIILSVGFLYKKVGVLANSSHMIITSKILEDVVPSDESFNYQDDSFFIAGALTEYDSETESIEDPKYGKLIFNLNGWYATEEGIVSYHEVLDDEICTDE